MIAARVRDEAPWRGATVRDTGNSSGNSVPVGRSSVLRFRHRMRGMLSLHTSSRRHDDRSVKGSFLHLRAGGVAFCRNNERFRVLGVAGGGRCYRVSGRWIFLLGILLVLGAFFTEKPAAAE